MAPQRSPNPGPSGSEAIGLIAAMVVLLLAFGSLYAMVIPILTAVFALIFGLSVVGLLSAWMPIGTAAPVVAAMIGLGVGIDYALLIVTRHRDGMVTGHAPGNSIPIAVSTAGRTVLIAGSTVIVALLRLILTGIPYVSALGLASATTVAVPVVMVVTLLPALLSVCGGGSTAPDPPGAVSTRRRPRSEWRRWTRRSSPGRGRTDRRDHDSARTGRAGARHAARLPRWQCRARTPPPERPTTLNTEFDQGARARCCSSPSTTRGPHRPKRRTG